MIDKFPGYLGGFTAIHADWPNYPSGSGWEIALRTFGYFPKETEFYKIDDIDTVVLFINENPKSLKDCFDYKYYHIAIWHEDLIELKRLGYIEGVNEISEFEFQLLRFENIKKDFGKNPKLDDEGNIIAY
jgi:hypothetical protein